MRKSLIVIASVILALALAGCSSTSNPDAPVSNKLTGTVLLPSYNVAVLQQKQLLPRLFNLFIGVSYADVLGLVPVANATVELVRLDSLGNVVAVLDTTTSDGSGNYSFTTQYTPDSTLAVRLPDELTPTRAVVTSNDTDITPVSEAVLREVINEIGLQSSSLNNYTVDEVAALLTLVNGMSIDVSTAPDFETAVGIVTSQAGSVLTDMAAGYAGSSVVSSLYQNNYAVFGETTTLVPPPQLNSTSAGIDHRSVDGGFGFAGSNSVNGGEEYSLITLTDMSTTSSYFCDLDPVQNFSFVPGSNGQVAVALSGMGGEGVAGAVSADSKLLVYPTDTTIAGIEGNSSGAGRGIRVAMKYSNPTPSQDNTTTKNPDLNDEVSGNYNLVWLTSYVNPTGIAGTFATSTGTAVLNFDPTTSALTTSGDTISALTATGAAYNTLTVDLGTGAVSSGSGAETLLTGGTYQVLPGNGVIAPLGDTATLLAGGSGSGDFLQGARLDTSGSVSPILVFSSKNPDGTMTGGGMGMGSSGCSDGGAGAGPGGMMTGGTSGEGRGLALAALQSSGLTVANITGTYNAVAQMNGFTDLTTGSAQVDTEIRYGTLTFDGAGGVTSGSTFHKTASMNSADAINGITTAVATSTGTDTYTGTYTVSGTDATMTLSLGTLTTGGGFVSPDGSFMVFPIIEDVAGTSGRRGLLLLVHQP